jgi:two-component system phosphate regulon sensor histidine kinase PhoR
MGLQGGPEVFGRYAGRVRLFLLVGLPLITIYTARLLDRRQRNIVDLNRQLRSTSTELRRQTEELQAIISGMHDGLLVTDGGERVLAVNPVGRAILGINPPNGVHPDVVQSDNFRAIQKVVDEALASPSSTAPRNVTPPHPRSGEEEPRTYQALASRIPTGPLNEPRVVVILRDTTEQTRLELAKSNFLAVVSHELRTPLNSIKGFLSMVLAGRAGELTDRQREFLTIVSGQAEYLLVAFNDLVEYSRIQIRRDGMDCEPVLLRNVAECISVRLLPLAASKHIRISNTVPEHLPPVRGDVLRLEQVVSNLVTNAVKFSPEGSTVTLWARTQDSDVRFSITDEGIGIAAEQQERIFDAFYQVSAGPARLHDGMGLGLAICRHIVEGSGGRLFVESEEGKGSSFTFVLPRYVADRLG